MSKRRAGKYKRIDANQPEIVDGLRRIGATVRSTATIGIGFPDICVGFRGKNYLFEIKDGKALVKPGQENSKSECIKEAKESCPVNAII